MRSKLSESDKAKIEDETDVVTMIKILHNSYFKVIFMAGHTKVIEFSNFVCNESISPEDNWNELLRLRREAYRYSSKQQFDLNWAWNVFIYGL